MWRSRLTDGSWRSAPRGRGAIRSCGYGRSNLDAHPLRGTRGATSPFWSPDGRSLGFFADTKLKKIDLATENVQVLADAPSARGGSWSSAGVILFAPNVADGLYRTSSGGGTATRVTRLDAARNETSHRWPQFLPDGYHFVYLARSSRPENTAGWIGSLDGGGIKQVASTNFAPRFAPPGLLLFVRDTSVLAQPFDLRKLTTAGESAVVVPKVTLNSGNGLAGFSASGVTLAYSTQLASRPTMLTWFDRAGKPLGTIGGDGAAGSFSNPSLSPDGRRVAIERVDRATTTPDIWLIDLDQPRELRFTFEPTNENGPVWSPDGKRIVFASRGAGASTFDERPASGVSPERVVRTFSATGVIPTSWSPDGALLIYQIPANSGWDIWALPMNGTREPFAIVQTPANDIHGELSPDGHWLAYASDESGRMEVFVQPFPPSGAKWQVSASGGSEPRWRRDQKELFFIAADRTMTTVPVDTSAAFTTGVARPLFRTHVPSPRIPFYRNYVPAADGQRFLVNTSIDAPATPVAVVVNWTAALNR